MTMQQTHVPYGGLFVECKQEGDAIPTELRRALEKVLRSDLSSVRLRTSPSLEGLGALACMQGENVYLSPSAPALDTAAGVTVLGHELAHVLQQRAGRVIVQGDNPVVEDEALEREADRVGLHCAAQLFRGSVSDPGMPDIVRTGERFVPTGKPAPIQFIIPSTVSYADFVAFTYAYCSAPLANQLSVAHILQDLYDFAADYNPNNVPAKVALGGQALYGQMAGYIRASAPFRITMQAGWQDITAQRNAYDAYYLSKSQGNNPQRNAGAETLTQTYLHVYPPPPQANANWRIGLNVLPTDMAAGMAVLAPLLGNGYASMDHVKFMSPGYADKADSVIVYCDNTALDYAQLQAAVLNQAANLNFQARVGAMWEEIQPGIGLASEPPPQLNGGVSFTEYRCMVVYLAYDEYDPQNRLNPSLADFRQFLAPIARAFGVNAAAPHLQGALSNSPNFPAWWQALLALHTAWRG
jgi:hypothetical protein